MKQLFSFLSADGKQRVAGYCWLPKNPVAVVQIVHGMAEYAERYEPFVEYLLQQQIAVISHDHLGHGHSVPEKNPQYGFFTDHHPVKTVIEDTHCVSMIAQKAFPQLPLIILGHSMGSFIVRNVVATYPHDYQGAIFMGTSGKREELKLVIQGVHYLNQVAGHKINHLLDALTFGGYYLLYPDKESRNNWLSSDRYEVASYDESPKMGFTFTNNGFFTLFALLLSCNSNKWYHALNQDLPYLIVSGEDDPIGQFGKGPVAVSKKMKKHGCQQVECILYPQMRHEILNEQNRQVVYQDIHRWMMHTLNRD